MAIAGALLPEFDHEMITTRKLLERVPQEKLDWKPHAKSMTLGVLATHLVTIVWWGEVTLDRAEFDAEGAPPRLPATSPAELLAEFDKNVQVTRRLLAEKTDPELMAPWSLKQGKQTFFTMPKAVVWRSFVMNHLVHHRAQLSVYLRMNDVPLPAMYGPSADES
ncbi:MAG: DinB family protein [Vicinamibacterales bacterium]